MSNVKDMEDKRYYSSELLLNLECLVESRFVFNLFVTLFAGVKSACSCTFNLVTYD